MMRKLSSVCGLFILASCSTVSEFGNETRPVFPVSLSAPEQWAAAGVAGEAPQADWLAQFKDQMMIDLVSEALSANPSLRAQYFTVQAAREQARATYGRSLPNVSITGTAGATSTYTEFGGVGDRVDNPTYGLSGDLSWEADLWGRVAAGINAAEADLTASEADLAAAKLSTVSQTAIAWIDLNAALAQERVAVQTYEARARALELTERRFSRGLSTALDVRTARTTLAQSEATIASQRQASGNAVRRLEVLLGRYPGNAIDAPAELPELEPLSLASSPTLLLARRPDIAAAEARVVAAGLRAEQARLLMLPSLRLTGSVSTSEDDFADVFDPERIAARLIGSLAAPIFNGGSLDADRDAAVARAEVAVESYASNVLVAWREVEDAIAADALLAQQEDAQARALEEAILAEDLATRQYTNGLVTIFNLIDSQTRRLNSESNLIAARSARASNRVRYHLALGGGVPVEDLETFPARGTISPEETILP